MKVLPPLVGWTSHASIREHRLNVTHESDLSEEATHFAMTNTVGGMAPSPMYALY